MISKGIKLHNGSLLAARVDPEQLGLAMIELFDPIEFIPFKFADPETGQIIETISMAPFMPISRDSSVLIKSVDILAFTNLHEAAERRYNDFLDQMARRAAKLNMSETEEIFGNDESDIPDDVLDLFDDMDMTKVQ